MNSKKLGKFDLTIADAAKLNFISTDTVHTAASHLTAIAELRNPLKEHETVSLWAKLQKHN